MINLALSVAAFLFLAWVGCIALMLALYGAVIVLTFAVQLVLWPIEVAHEFWKNWRDA